MQVWLPYSPGATGCFSSSVGAVTLYHPLAQRNRLRLHLRSTQSPRRPHPIHGRRERTYTGNADPTGIPAAADGISVTDTVYSYDTLGRLDAVTVTERFDTPLTTPEVTDYVYDLVGNLAQTRSPNGVVTDYQYDALKLAPRDADAGWYRQHVNKTAFAPPVTQPTAVNTDPAYPQATHQAIMGQSLEW